MVETTVRCVGGEIAEVLGGLGERVDRMGEGSQLPGFHPPDHVGEQLPGQRGSFATQSVHVDGGMCPEIVVPARKLHPSNSLTAEQLALVETLVIGRHAVARGAPTKDDRVHPGHARKMAAQLEQYGFDFFYYENIEGGHGGTANQEQLAMRTALEYAYFVRQLMPAVWDRDATD